MDNKSSERLNDAAVPIKFNPADYFTFVLDQEIRNAGMPGGYCGFVLELDSAPDLAVLQKRLDILTERFPQATARLERRGRHYAWVPTTRRLLLECEPSCPPNEDIACFCRQRALAILNRPAPMDTTPPLSFHWLGHAQGGALMLCWLHPLLDARGGRILLDFLGSGTPDAPKETASLVLQKLSSWSLWKTMQLTFKAIRHNARANELDSSLPTPLEQGAQSLRLRVHRYSPEQSAAISRSALQHTGLAGRSLYTIGCLMRAMELAGPPKAKAGYCIPYAFNLRKQNALTPVFGNHVGCLFAQATREQVRNRNGLFQHLLEQYRKTVREELDFAYLPLMWLGQYLSPHRYAARLRKQHSGGELSSCWFSDIGEIRFEKAAFMGTTVTGMFHLSWITLPPGLALLTGQINGQIVLSYNYLFPAIDESWLEQLMAIMNAELLGETG
jgi:hypothetical protein